MTLHRTSPTALCVLISLSMAWPAAGQLETLETDDLQMVYIAPIHSYLVPHAARCFQNSIAFQKRVFEFAPSERATVILSDFSDYGNAGAGAVPRNGVAVSIAPPSFVYETYPSNERLNTLMNHELVHVANFDKSGRRDRFFRALFRGKVRGSAEQPGTILWSYLTAPRTTAPRWFHEGSATFMETWMAGGIGRAQGSFDEMVFRSMVRDGTRFYDPLGLVAEGTQVDFQTEMGSYLYGTRFMSWLAYEWSPERLVDWVGRADGSKGYHAAAFRQIYGVDLDEAWNRWEAFEREFQSANLDSLRVYPITPLRDISRRPLGSISRAYLDAERGRIYAGLNYPGIVAHIAAIDVRDGHVEELVEVDGPMMYSVTSLAYDPDRRILYYTADNGALRDIVRLDPVTREQETLLSDVRIGDLAFDRSDRSLWGVRHNDGYAMLVRVPYPYDHWEEIRTYDYGTLAYDVDVSADGQKISLLLVRASGRGSVRVFDRSDLLLGGDDPVRDFDFGSTLPMNFVFGPGDSTLVGSSYLSGVSNVFRYNLRRDRWDALSNTETGLFRPIPVAEDSLVAFRYSGQGFVPAWMPGAAVEDVNSIEFLGAAVARRHPSVLDWRVGSPREVPLDSLVTRRGPYRALRSVELESVYPILEGYKFYTSYGLRMDLSDPISMHRFNVSGSYTPVGENLDDDERVHGELRYQRYDWRLSARYNDADFYDLFGPTKRSRKGYSVGAGYNKTLLYDMPRELSLAASVAYYGDLERLPDYQNVSASYSELLNGSVRLNFKNLRFSLGAVDYEKGVTSFVELSDNHVNGRSFIGLLGSLQLGIPLFYHSSLWLRGYGAVAPPDRDEPFSNFFLGGFGNNWVDRLDSKRYRDWYAFPGFELNELGGTNFLKGLVDWNLPPLRFSRLGKPSFFASWIRASLFSGVAVTNLDAPDLRLEAANLGAQLDIRFTFLSHQNLTASVGYAVGVVETRDPTDEFMLSLRIH